MEVIENKKNLTLYWAFMTSESVIDTQRACLAHFVLRLNDAVPDRSISFIDLKQYSLQNPFQHSWNNKSSLEPAHLEKKSSENFNWIYISNIHFIRSITKKKVNAFALWQDALSSWKMASSSPNQFSIDRMRKLFT